MRVAVLIPCYNEQRTIADVVGEWRAALPDARVYVYDNNSKDCTIKVASDAGAIVRKEPLQGKGNVVRRMFADVDADVYVMTDGDATYHAASAPGMIELLVKENLDMVVGARLSSDPCVAFRQGHQFGNRVLTGFVAWLFGGRLSDMLSGYRVFSRRFVKSFPALSQGFEIETELTVHALELSMPTAEVPTPYGARPEGSTSKLRTFRDGWRILITIVRLLKEERPFFFFGMWFIAFGLAAVTLGAPIVSTFLETGLVPRFPTAILATGIVILAFLSLTVGLILDSVKHGRWEVRRLQYLALASRPRDQIDG